MSHRLPHLTADDQYVRQPCSAPPTGQEWPRSTSPGLWPNGFVSFCVRLPPGRRGSLRNPRSCLRTRGTVLGQRRVSRPSTDAIDQGLYADRGCSSLYGDSEELLGKWFKRTGKRDEIFLATKFGFVKGSKTLEVDSSGEYCKKACTESLRLLDIDSIDLCKHLTFPRLIYHHCKSLPTKKVVGIHASLLF